MASSWGESWNVSWGTSWAFPVPAPPLPPPPPPPTRVSVSWDGYEVDAVNVGDTAESGFIVVWTGWDSLLVTSLVWERLAGEGVEMFQLRTPIRKNNPVTFTNTFRNVDGTRINLEGYFQVQAVYKLNGEVKNSEPASFVDKTNGMVRIVSLRFGEVGKYDLQFVCTDGEGGELYGEPIQYDVVPNIEDLALGTNISD